MDKKIPLHWATQENNCVANALGYNTHNSNMKRYGEKYFDYSDDADIALTIAPADMFTAVPGKVNVLFSMFEFLDLPESYKKGIAKAKYIIVPSHFCKELFQRYTKKPIYVCFEGCEPENYPYVKREHPGRSGKFRILWVGAPNPRKGYPLMLEAIRIFEKFPNFEIYLKTTAPDINFWQSLKNIWKHRKMLLRDHKGRKTLRNMLMRLPRPGLANKVRVCGKHKNIIFDTRKLPQAELTALYNSAHVFALPTFGEGWGLTLCEAMSTGAPSVATAVTGCADFFDDSVGYPIDYHIRDQELLNYDLKTKGYSPDTTDFVTKLMYIYTHYREALEKGERASKRIHSKFTWSDSAWRLAQIIKEIKEKEAKKG